MRHCDRDVSYYLLAVFDKIHVNQFFLHVIATAYAVIFSKFVNA